MFKGGIRNEETTKEDLFLLMLTALMSHGLVYTAIYQVQTESTLTTIT